MRRRPFISVTVDVDRDLGLLRGPDARRLAQEAGGQPSWSARSRAWIVPVAVASDVLAIADAERYAIKYARVGGECG